MVFHVSRRRRQPELSIPAMEIPIIDRDEIARVLRRTAIYIIPAIATFALFTLVALTIRRLLAIPEAIQLEPVVEAPEPAHEVSA
jgi:hypothetical protein